MKYFFLFASTSVAIWSGLLKHRACVLIHICLDFLCVSFHALKGKALKENLNYRTCHVLKNSNTTICSEVMKKNKNTFLLFLLLLFTDSALWAGSVLKSTCPFNVCPLRQRPDPRELETSGQRAYPYWKTENPFFLEQFNIFLRFSNFLDFLVFAKPPTVHSGGVGRVRVCGCWH